MFDFCVCKKEKLIKTGERENTRSKNLRRRRSRTGFLQSRCSQQMSSDVISQLFFNNTSYQHKLSTCYATCSCFFILGPNTYIFQLQFKAVAQNRLCGQVNCLKDSDV